MADDGTKNYSLWLTPEGETYKRLKLLIDNLSSKYDTPPFEPHVTLIGGVRGTEKEIKEKTEETARLIRQHQGPFDIKFLRAGYRNEHFKALFLEAEKEKPIILAMSMARDIFFHNQAGEYFPHLSLLYGDFPSRTKIEMIQMFVRNVDTKFEVNRLHLFSTEGEVKEWEYIDSFDL